MEKTTVLALVLLCVVCAQALEMRVTPTPAERKLLRPSGSPLLTRSNRDCSTDGIFPIPGDCTAYIICRKGREYRRQCPANFRFDSVMYCTPDDTADCGAPLLKQAQEKNLCPRSYGIFPYPDDCHKYVVCHEGRGRVRTCPEGTVYLNYTGCVDGDTCPIPHRSEAKTAETPDREVCELARDPGPCNGNFQRYFYDSESNSCKAFIYGGCGGNGNNFETENTCRETCVRETETSGKSICDLPAQTGSCHGYFPRYYYDSKSGDCKRFVYGGCRGNDNNFVTLDECKDTCVREIETEEHDYEEFQCKRSGRFANPNSCDSYIECFVKRDSVEMELVQCPRDQHYNVETKQCDEKCRAQCDQELDTDCAPHPDFLCPGDGTYFYLGNCSRYQICKDGKATSRECPRGTHFSKETIRCEMPCNAKCNQSLASECGWTSSDEDSRDEDNTKETLLQFNCKNDGFYSHPNTDCSKFFQCSNGEGYGMHCAKGLHFSSEHQRCLSPCKARCDQNIPCFIEERLCDKGKCFHCPTEDGEFSDLFDCSIYHECKAGSSTIKACHDGKLFDHRTSQCTRKEKALCVYQCEKLNSVNPHPQDMNSFIQCENGRSTVKKCPDGKVFKEQIGQCEDLHSERNSLLDMFYTDGNEWTR